MKTKPCPRCGKDIEIRQYGRHVAVCERIPDADTLRAEYAAGATCYELAMKYGVSAPTMSREFARVGLQMDRYRRKTDRYCPCCGLLLTHPLVPAAGDLCAYCALEHRTPGRDWVMEVRV